VGTPANNQLGVWTGDGTIEGDSSLTWDGNELAVNGQMFTIMGTGTVSVDEVDIDWNDGNSSVIDLETATGDVEVFFTNPNIGASYFIKIIQGSTARTVTFPSNCLFPSETPPFTLDVTTTNLNLIIVSRTTKII